MSSQSVLGSFTVPLRSKNNAVIAFLLLFLLDPGSLIPRSAQILITKAPITLMCLFVFAHC